jgi:hypothetical protein
MYFLIFANLINCSTDSIDVLLENRMKRRAMDLLNSSEVEDSPTMETRIENRPENGMIEHTVEFGISCTKSSKVLCNIPTVETAQIIESDHIMENDHIMAINPIMENDHIIEIEQKAETNPNISIRKSPGKSRSNLKIATNSNVPHKLILFQIEKPEDEAMKSEGNAIKKEVEEKVLRAEKAREVLKVAKDLVKMANKEIERTLEKRKEFERKKIKTIGIPVELENEKNYRPSCEN